MTEILSDKERARFYELENTAKTLAKGMERWMQDHLDDGADGVRLDQWQPIETAPKDGTVIDVWLGDNGDPTTTAGVSEVEFYCTPGTKRAPGWSWDSRRVKWVPRQGLGTPVFVQPSHWQPLPEGPQE